MNRQISLLTTLLVATVTAGAANQPQQPIQEVPFTQVHLTDVFWAPRIEVNRTVSIPSSAQSRIPSFDPKKL